MSRGGEQTAEHQTETSTVPTAFKEDRLWGCSFDGLEFLQTGSQAEVSGIDD